MTVDIIKVVGEVGSIAVLVLVLYFVWRYGGGFVGRLMDNLDTQVKNNEAAIRTQEQTNANLRSLCDRFDDAEKRDTAASACRKEMLSSLQELTGAVRGLAQQMQAHEGRAQKRHEQLLQRDQELIEVIQGMNGKHDDGGSG